MSSGALRLVNIADLEGDAPQLHRDRRSCTQDPPRLHLTYSFLLLFIWIPTISFNKLIKGFLDFVSCLSKLTKLEEQHGNLWFAANQTEVMISWGTYCLRLACEVRWWAGWGRRGGGGSAVSWAWALNLWDLMCSNSIRVDLLCRIPNWCHRIAWWCGENPYIMCQKCCEYSSSEKVRNTEGKLEVLQLMPWITEHAIACCHKQYEFSKYLLNILESTALEHIKESDYIRNIVYLSSLREKLFTSSVYKFNF